MSTTTVVILVVVGIAVAAILFLATAGARRDRTAATSLRREARRKDKSNPALSGDAAPTGREVERNAVLERRGTEVVPVPAEPAPIAEFVPPDAEVIAVTRRQFLNRGSATLMGLGLAAFGGSVLAFLWPQIGAGFGAKITAGKLSDILQKISDTRSPYYVAEARSWVTAYPADALPKAKKIYAGAVLTGMESGVVALYQKCVHLGCRVPWCGSSQWFECPCHGSKYNRVGEKKGGPAPRGLDRFAVSVSGGTLTIDTGTLSQGPPIGTNTTGQEQEGPHCA